jgi:hypothetical protein
MKFVFLFICFYFHDKNVNHCISLSSSTRVINDFKLNVRIDTNETTKLFVDVSNYPQKHTIGMSKVEFSCSFVEHMSKHDAMYLSSFELYVSVPSLYVENDRQQK